MKHCVLHTCMYVYLHSTRLHTKYETYYPHIHTATHTAYFCYCDIAIIVPLEYEHESLIQLLLQLASQEPKVLRHALQEVQLASERLIQAHNSDRVALMKRLKLYRGF